ncbi:MAG: Benzoyl-CoA reductase/2-hydroxyglutaryl-CoA dehydratase subunit, BcrC/BadD/HgdB [Dehalococcoidales bacterium]|nr:Benzoyl-CoA reductase/2-hydroxyglutaryl-CoA dehydratase subunit, BcrC/BadD/HgdB [Dehalococcoidales bacterium]
MPKNIAQEKRLSALVQGNSPESRKQHALKAKEKGKKVIGLLCQYAPEEVVYAAGMHPWRVTGTWDPNLSLASVHRDLDSCRYCTHTLEALLRGDLKFLDGIMISDWDDDRRRLFDVWRYVNHPPYAVIYTTPKNRSEITERYFAREISRMAAGLEELGKVKITEAKLREAIAVYNQTRELLICLYQLRKRPVPPLTGAEILGITTACMVMDKVEFNAELTALMPYLQQREVDHKPDEPRILVTSDLLDNPQFLQIIEGEGCLIAMDDLDTGSRWFHQLVDVYAKDPIAAISRRLCWRPADSTAFNWEEQIEQMIAWVREYRIDGVIELFEEFSPPRNWRSPLVVREMARSNIPFVRIARGYDVGSVEQLRTRAGAFLEMIQVAV